MYQHIPRQRRLLHNIPIKYNYTPILLQTRADLFIIFIQSTCQCSTRHRFLIHICTDYVPIYCRTHHIFTLIIYMNYVFAHFLGTERLVCHIYMEYVPIYFKHTLLFRHIWLEYIPIFFQTHTDLLVIFVLMGIGITEHSRDFRTKIFFPWNKVLSVVDRLRPDINEWLDC